MKKKIMVILALLAVAMLCVSCEPSDDKIVKIAVMGDKDNFYPDYESGIIRAIEDLNNEYADMGFRFEYTIYDDNSSYEKGAQIIDELADDESVTVVIGSRDIDINKTAVYVFNEGNKLFVVPYALYDSVYESNNYKTVFSLASSGNKLGTCLAVAAVKETNAKRWAVCAADDEFSMSKMRGFLQSEKSSGINIVDCSDIVTLMSDFDSEMNRLKLLGTEGIVIFPGNAYTSGELFDLIKAIRREAPDMVCMGDNGFDDSAKILADPELMEAMSGFILANEFLKINDDAEEVAKFDKMRADFAEEHGNKFDLWHLQAYNMIRMIGDTAVKSNTTESTEIAEILHKEGYDGLCQKFVFNEKGSQILETIQYFVMKDDGTTREITIDE